MIESSAAKEDRREAEGSGMIQLVILGVMAGVGVMGVGFGA